MRSWKKRAWVAAKLIVTSGLSIWIITLVEWPEFWRILEQSVPWIVGLVVVLRFGGLVISSYKWQQLLAVHTVRYRLRRLLRWYLVASFLNHFLPSNIGGDGYRIYKTWDNARGKAVSVLAVLLERVTGFGALAALGYGAAVALYLGGATGGIISAVAGLGSLGLVAAVTASGLSPRFGLARLVRGTRFWKYFESLGRLARDFRTQRARTVSVVALSFVFHVNKVIAVWLLLFALGVTINPLELMVAILVVDFAGLLPISLGGLGVVEGSFILATGQFGVSEEVALATMLLLRVLMLPFYLAGAAFYFTGGRNWNGDGLTNTGTAVIDAEPAHAE